MSPYHNVTTVEGSLFSSFGENWHTYIYLLIITFFSLVPLIMLCICAIRFCLSERDWALEAAREEHHENVQRLVSETSRILRNQTKVKAKGVSVD